MSRFVVAAAAVLAAPASAYVAPAHGVSAPALVSTGSAQLEPLLLEEPEVQAQSSFGVLAAGFGLGAVVGWLNSRKQEVACVAAAAAMVASPMAANAMIDYDGVKYLGSGDKVDINNANIQAYRQFPGMYPTVAGKIVTHGPYNTVQDLYNIEGMTDQLKGILKKYEGNLLVLPVSPAYYLDRLNNGHYR